MKTRPLARSRFASPAILRPIPRSKPRAQGFSILEICVVIAMVAVLLALALPSYQRYLQSAKRAQATQDLLQLAQSLEQAFAAQNAYPADLSALISTTLSSNPNYVYSFRSVNSADSFVLQATPVGAQSNDKCGVLLLDQRLSRGANGVLDNRAELTRDCWQR